MTPEERFALIMSRQAHFKWGETYMPSVLAVPREAPKGSRICRVNSRKLCRPIHALSTPEKVFTQLALYHPGLLDIHEQKMLWPYQAAHPLRGHPLIKGTFPPPVKGTMEIAKEIGFKHHEVVVTTPGGSRQKMPFPYQGDLLLYLMNSQGRLYAVNWTVKDRKDAFKERRCSAAKTPVQRKKDREHAELRATLEQKYYASAGIRTVQMSLDGLDPTVVANLDLLFAMHDLSLSHEQELLVEFSAAVEEAVRTGEPLAQIAIQYGARWGNRDQFLAKIYQDIWERKLPVNFFKPILIDHPLHTDGGDLLTVYGAFFQELEP
ncbi:UNVERIFIED_ORG: hypothetical protein J2Y76_005185 [Pseudomonas reinekei]|uniref:hypothetical protein n=1 Tax=Pseudomonas laurylsulfatiphila TaxID=2011015 RepID=UPI003D217DAA|nr:hypothetical protein [Pseudomonas reinekei]